MPSPTGTIRLCGVRMGGVVGVSLLVLSAWLVSAPPVEAQAGAQLGNQEQRRIERAIRESLIDPDFRRRVDTDLALSERTVLDFGGSFTLTTLHLVDSTNNSRRMLAPQFDVYGRVVVDNAHTFFVRSQFQYRDFSPGDSFDDNGDLWEEPFVDRYWYEFDLARAQAAYTGVSPDSNFRIRLGRQFIDWGQGLALSEDLIGALAELELGKFRLTGLAGVTPTDESIIDFDASRAEFNRDTERGFFGGEIRYIADDLTEFYFSYLRMADYNSSSRSAAGLATPVEFDYDANYFIWGLEGALTNKLTYEGEFVYQSGSSTADPLRTAVGEDQSSEDISAWAARMQLSYFLRDERRSRLQAEVMLASGDGDRLIATDTVAGNAPFTDDLAFNSLGFVNTGLAFSPSFSNVQIYRIGGSTFPILGSELFRDFQLGFDLFFHNKLQSTAPIDEVTADEAFLGVEMDWSMNWRIRSDLSLTSRYGLFLPNDEAFAESDARHFLFFGVTLAF